MGLDLVAHAETDAPWTELSARLARAADAAGVRWLPDLDGSSSGSFELGPADPVSLLQQEGLVQLHARSTPWGPGYHQRCVALLEALEPALGRPWLRVHDDTGFWTHRDPTQLRRAFLRWALTLWDGVGQLRRGLAVCLGEGDVPAELPPGQVATPIGFRGEAWIRRTRRALEEALACQGTPGPEAREAFLWWHREPDALDWVLLGRAICTTEVIWRPFGRGEDVPSQQEARLRALGCFEEALRRDPTAPVPRPELQRLYQLLGRSSELRAPEAAEEPFHGGYREGWLRTSLDGWQLELPGWLRAGVDADDGHDVYYDDVLTVHLSFLPTANGFSARSEADRHLEQLGPERARARLELLAAPGAEGYAVELPYGDAAPELHCLIQGQVGRSGERVSFTAVARSPEAREAALRLGRSLRPEAR